TRGCSISEICPPDCVRCDEYSDPIMNPVRPVSVDPASLLVAGMSISGHDGRDDERAATAGFRVSPFSPHSRFLHQFDRRAVMRKTAVGVIAVVTASAVLSVVGLGLANAAPDSSVPASDAAMVATIRTEAADLQALHDQVQTTYGNKDVNGLYSSAKTLAGELALVRGSATRAAMASGTTDLITRAQQLTGQLIQK